MFGLVIVEEIPIPKNTQHSQSTLMIFGDSGIFFNVPCIIIHTYIGKIPCLVVIVIKVYSDCNCMEVCMSILKRIGF